MTNFQILKRLYFDYTHRFLNKILVSVFFSLVVAGATSLIAFLLDPAIKKIFIEKDKQLMIIIPFAIVFAFTMKGVSLYLAKNTLIYVSGEIQKILQLQLIKSILNSDLETLDKKHSGKFVSITSQSL